MDYFSYNNHKLRKQRIRLFNLPAGKTCPQAGECADYCYAQKGFYIMPAVKAFRAKSLELTLNSELFKTQINRELKTHKDWTTARLHDSGDFYYTHYLLDWIQIALKNKDHLFYAYTKSVEMVKQQSHIIPDNFRIIFSYGGKQDNLINPETDRHAKIFKTKKELEKAGYVDCSKDDLLTATTDSLKIGLIFH